MNDKILSPIFQREVAMRIHIALSIALLFTIHTTTPTTTHAESTEQQYVPIVLVHGAFASDYDMQPTEQYIRKYMGNNVYIKNIRPPMGAVSSVGNIYSLIEHMRKQIENDPILQNGFNIVAHSQGGLVARYYLERYNNPRVLTYISWGTPHQGIFGMPGTIDDHFKWLDHLEDEAYNVLYSWSFQKFVSFAGYWHDTLHHDKYIKKSCFLPYINNEIDHEFADRFKENICSLKNMVLVASHHEDIVEPDCSCHFGFYKNGSNSEIVSLFESELYQQDSLGLKTLHESGRLHLLYADCPHVYFQENENNFVENTLEFLKADPDNVPLVSAEPTTTA